MQKIIRNLYIYDFNDDKLFTHIVSYRMDSKRITRPYFAHIYRGNNSGCFYSFKEIIASKKIIDFYVGVEAYKVRDALEKVEADEDIYKLAGFNLGVAEVDES